MAKVSDEMNGLQKAAILLIALGPEKSAMIFFRLSLQKVSALEF